MSISSISISPTTTAAFFEAKYRGSEDPWNFATSSYETARYDAIVAALSHRRYQHAFEPGCSIGVLTERLAGFCDRVDACDLSPTAVMHARQRCAGMSHVRVACASLAEPPHGEPFDLLVLSEIGYYFHGEEWTALSSDLVTALPAGATVLAAHWLGESCDHLLTGDEVHERLRANPCLHLEYEEHHPSFRLDRWTRV